MWNYFGDFVSLLRNVPAYRELPLTELLPAVFPDLTFVRVVRANKVRQAVSLWKAVQTATWRQEDATERRRSTRSPRTPTSPPYKSFLDEHRPRCASTTNAISHLLGQILRDEASLGRVLRARPDPAGAGAVRELRRRLRDQHGERARARSGSTPPEDFQLRAAHRSKPVRRAQRRLGAALRGAPARDRVRSGPDCARARNRCPSVTPHALRQPARTSSTSTPTTPGRYVQPYGTRSRPPTSSCSPTRECSSAKPSAPRRPARAAAPRC